MTKLRTPNSFAAAITRIAGAIGYDVAARVVGKSERCVYAWSAPDASACPSIAEALALDAAYRAATGEGAPLFEAFAHQLDLRVAALTADRRELVAEAATAARECGEAVAAALTVSAGNASPVETHRALAEADQAQGALGALVRRITSFLPSGAGPGAGKAGGTPIA